MPLRIQLHLAVRGGLSGALAGRLDAVTDRLLDSSALKGAGPARAVGLVHTPGDPFPAGYPRHAGYTQFHVDGAASAAAARAAGFGLCRVDSVSEFHREPRCVARRDGRQ